jgi:hypothetical protein
VNGDLQVRIYKVWGTGNYGPPPFNTQPLELDGEEYDPATFDDGMTDGHVRLPSSVGNAINFTFGAYPVSGRDGFWVYLKMNDPASAVFDAELTCNP